MDNVGDLSSTALLMLMSESSLLIHSFRMEFPSSSLQFLTFKEHGVGDAMMDIDCY